MRRLLTSLMAAVILGLLLGSGSRDVAAEWPWSVHFLFPPQVGLNTACLTCGWHGSGCTSPYSFGSKLDFAASCSDAGQTLYFRGYGFHTPWASDTYVGYAESYTPTAWACSEAQARIYDKDGNLLGAIRYVHAVGTYSGRIDLYASGGSGRLNQSQQGFAAMVNPESEECRRIWGWSGVHVHESHEDNPIATPFFLRNTSATCPQYPPCGPAYPCATTLHNQGGASCTYDPRDWYNNWVRGLCSGDPDCDFFKDAKEQYIGTDPNDNCPDNTSDDAWPPDINKNRMVNSLDIIYLKPAIGCMVGQPCYNRRYDLDANGSVQGLDAMFIRPFIGTGCS